jgi:hypothetical protein
MTFGRLRARVSVEEHEEDVHADVSMIQCNRGCSMTRIHVLTAAASIVLAASASQSASAASYDLQGCLEQAEGQYNYTLRHTCSTLAEPYRTICIAGAEAARAVEQAGCYTSAASGAAMERAKKAWQYWIPF